MARILIIDDDPKVCQVLARLVEEQGHEAAAAHALAEGLGMAEGGGYDVVFLDLRLPDGHGLEAPPRLRRLEPAPEVIIITGAGDPQAAQRLKQLVQGLDWDGAVEYCQTRTGLASTLCRPDSRRTAVVALAADVKETMALGWLGELRHKLCLLLILPDSRPYTLNLGYALQPRYVTSAEQDLSEVGQILNHLRNHEPDQDAGLN